MKSIVALAAVFSIVAAPAFTGFRATLGDSNIVAESNLPSPGSHDTALAESNGRSPGGHDAALAESNGPSAGGRDTAMA